MTRGGRAGFRHIHPADQKRTEAVLTMLTEGDAVSAIAREPLETTYSSQHPDVNFGFRGPTYLERDALRLVQLDQSLIYWQRRRSCRQTQHKLGMALGWGKGIDPFGDVVSNLKYQRIARLMRETHVVSYLRLGVSDGESHDVC